MISTGRSLQYNLFLSALSISLKELAELSTNGGTAERRKKLTH